MPVKQLLQAMNHLKTSFKAWLLVSDFGQLTLFAQPQDHTTSPVGLARIGLNPGPWGPWGVVVPVLVDVAERVKGGGVFHTSKLCRVFQGDHARRFFCYSGAVDG
jgi:hypothetical protein